MQNHPAFQELGYRLGSLRLYSLAAVLRYIAHKLVGAQYHEYEAITSKSCGYAGWLEHPRLGVLAFRRMGGTLQFKW